MQNHEEQIDTMHRTNCANVVAMPVSEPTQDGQTDSATHDRLYRAATVAAALLLLAGAAAA